MDDDDDDTLSVDLLRSMCVFCKTADSCVRYDAYRKIIAAKHAHC